jgi:hypothetical protein
MAVVARVRGKSSPSAVRAYVMDLRGEWVACRRRSTRARPVLRGSGERSFRGVLVGSGCEASLRSRPQAAPPLATVAPLLKTCSLAPPLRSGPTLPERESPTGAAACSLGSERRRRGDPQVCEPTFPRAPTGRQRSRSAVSNGAQAHRMVSACGSWHGQPFGVKFLQFIKGDDSVCISTCANEGGSAAKARTVHWSPEGSDSPANTGNRADETANSAVPPLIASRWAPERTQRWYYR